MKKLIIISAVLLMSIASQAASFKWTAANIYASNLTTKYTGSATLYAYLTTAGAETATEVAVANVVAGVVKDGSQVGLTFSNDNLTVNNNYTFYFVIEDNGKTFTSVSKSCDALAVGAGNLSFGNMTTATKDSSNWSNVPEPTSAMLLALGIAALALRRKRA